MNAKKARAALRVALALFRKRIRFPRIRIKDVLESEDIVSIVKEFAGQKLQKFLEKR